MFNFWKLRRNKIHRFQTKIQLSSKKGNYEVKTVTSQEELLAALKLRYQVFRCEMMGKPMRHGFDVDELDFVCDHLIIKDRDNDLVVGTYRLNSSLFGDTFYSAGEFNLTELKNLPGIKLELGRACIHPDYRKGIVISALWRGIAEYMSVIGADWLFGCATVTTTSPREAALLAKYFEEKGHLHQGLNCPPTLDYTLGNFDLWRQAFREPLSEQLQNEAEKLIPGLVGAYFRAGAQILSEPAYDAEFQCLDFLTVLNKQNLNAVLWRKYGPQKETSSSAAMLNSNLS